MEVIVAFILLALCSYGGYRVIKYVTKNPNEPYQGAQKALKSNLDHYRKGGIPSIPASMIVERGEIQETSKLISYEIQEDGTILRSERKEFQPKHHTSSSETPQYTMQNLHPIRLREYEQQRGASDAVQVKIAEHADALRTQTDDGAPSPPITHDECREEYIRRLMAGEELSFSECCLLLEAGVNDDVKRLICQNHLSQSNNPPIDILHNFSSERATSFLRLIHLVVGIAIGKNGETIPSMYELLRYIILFSRNQDALYAIADMQESDFITTGYNKILLEELKGLAYDRYCYLTTRE